VLRGIWKRQRKARNIERRENWRKYDFGCDYGTLEQGRGEKAEKMGKKRNWRNAAQRVPRVGTFYHSVSCTAASHVRGDGFESRKRM
jgi:hypothetical protein